MFVVGIPRDSNTRTPHQRHDGPEVDADPVAEEGVGDDDDGAWDAGGDAQVGHELLLAPERKGEKQKQKKKTDPRTCNTALSDASQPATVVCKKWKPSRNMCRYYTRFGAADLYYAQSVLTDKISALELTRKLIKSALLVGLVERAGPPPPSKKKKKKPGECRFVGVGIVLQSVEGLVPELVLPVAVDGHEHVPRHHADDAHQEDDPVDGGALVLRRGGGGGGGGGADGDLLEQLLGGRRRGRGGRRRRRCWRRRRHRRHRGRGLPPNGHPDGAVARHLGLPNQHWCH